MIRPADPADLEAIVRMRCDMWTELNPDDPSDAAFEERVRDYYRGALPGPGLAVWMAEDEAGAIVGMVTLLVHQHPPRKHGTELRGYLTNMYVAPQARRRGHGRRLMDAVVAHAQERAMRRVILRTTEAGRPLYGAVGFAQLEHLARDFV